MANGTSPYSTGADGLAFVTTRKQTSPGLHVPSPTAPETTAIARWPFPAVFARPRYGPPGICRLAGFWLHACWSPISTPGLHSVTAMPPALVYPGISPRFCHLTVMAAPPGAPAAEAGTMSGVALTFGPATAPATPAPRPSVPARDNAPTPAATRLLHFFM